jgi:mono/diheme cytochrome c family protein
MRNVRRRLMLGVGVAFALSACGSEKKERGLDLLPDMFNTPAYESQAAGTIEVDARDAQGKPIRRAVHFPAMLTPPVGTVARGQSAYPFAATDWAGAKTNRNPLAMTPQALKQGQHDFLTFCAPCHGRDGNAANGYVAKTFSGIPSLNGMPVLQLSEGEIYHVLTMGKGRMWNQRAQLPPERRWAVVHFLKVQARAAVAAEDVAKLLPYLDSEIEKHPDDAALKARRVEILRLAELAKTDLAGLAGAGDGHEFIPPLPAVPEYVGPTWPVPEDGK